MQGNYSNHRSGTENGNYKHGLRYLPENGIFYEARRRILNKNHPAYYNYGGRGLKIDDDFLGKEGFLNFYKEIGPRPDNKHYLDRIDNDKGYIKGNIRWCSRHESALNRRSTRWITHNGDTKSLRDWATILGIDESLLHYHLRKRSFECTYNRFTSKK